MGFPPELLDEIRAHTPLGELIGRRVALTRRGREFVGLCPFHGEKTPSFTVNEAKGFFHCFGCGAHGDAIGFAMRIDALSFPEAVERLARAAGVALPRRSPEEAAAQAARASLHQVVEAACAWFETRLAESREARAYLETRGVERDTAAAFRLGWAPAERAALKRALTAGGIAEAALVEAGLLIVPDDGTPYDRFRGRIVFPIADRGGRVVGFGGRALGEATPKYLNSPETPLFHKGALLYNLAGARTAAREAGTVVLVEGYMDVIALARAGLAHAVAPLGTALTETQLAELWRLAPEPVICLDGDAAGQRAALRAAKLALPLIEPRRSLSFVRLPPDDDPDSFVAREGAAAFRDLVAAAEPLYKVAFRLALRDNPMDTPERRSEAWQDARKFVAKIAYPELRTQYWEEFEGFLKGKRQDDRRQRAERRRPTYEPRVPGINSAMRERRLLTLLLDWPALIDEFEEVLGRIELRAPHHRRLLEALLAAGDDRDPRVAELAVGLRRAADGPGELRSATVASVEKARTMLRDVLHRYHLEALERDLRAAEAAFAEHEDAAAWERLAALTVRYEEASARPLDEPEGGGLDRPGRRRHLSKQGFQG